MIPIFRKIRKKMADDNKPMKYLRYAIGEIALVVIGILIALQINNWNQNHHLRNEESKYINAMLKEAETNLSLLKVQLDNGKAKMNAINYIIENLDKPVSNINIDSLHWALGTTMNLSQFKMISVTFLEMKSSGKLSLIHSDSLRKELIDYHLGIEEVNTIINIGPNHHWKEVYMPFVNDYFDNTQILAKWAEIVNSFYETPDIEWDIKKREISISALWSLGVHDPLKIKFNNELAQIYSAEWWLIHVKKDFINRTKKLKELMKENLIRK